MQHMCQRIPKYIQDKQCCRTWNSIYRTKRRLTWYYFCIFVES